MSSTDFLPIVILIGVLAVDAWVYIDANDRRNDGRPVAVRLGQFEVRTPTAWLLGCLLLWFLFVPLYLAGRSR